MGMTKSTKAAALAKAVAPSMSQLRWALTGALAVLALWATVQSMRTYQAHEMTTGVMAVISLAVLLMVGLASLALARVRITRELTALRGGDQSSELLSARRARLEAIRASGTLPDRLVLAEVTRANEAGRAYIGRYLVATTVLIGLVGTFAGLMQTLSKMAPLFAEKAGGDMALLATPLAGLHVTFGASLVAILATLALALAQGDLALCEEQAISLLEDRTTHELIPALWPASGDPAERTVRALEELKATFSDALAASVAASLTSISEGARTQAERSARALETVAGTVEQQLTRLCATVDKSLQESASRQRDALVAAATSQTAALTDSTRVMGKELEGAAQKLATAWQSSVDATMAHSATALEETGQKTMVAVGELADKTADALAKLADKTAQAVDELGRTSTKAVDELGRTSTKAVDDLGRLSIAALAESMGRATSSFEESIRRASDSAEEVARAVTEASRVAAQANGEALVRTLDPLFAAEAARLDQVRGALGQVGSGLDATVTRLGELTVTLTELAREHVAAVDRGGQAVLAAFDRAVLGGGAALDAAAGTLATAAGELKAGVDVLAPRIGALTAELEAVTREVALLSAARAPDDDGQALLLGELDRLGAGLDSLSELVRQARSGPSPDDEPVTPGAIAFAAGDPASSSTTMMAATPAAEPTLDDAAVSALPDQQVELSAETDTALEQEPDNDTVTVPSADSPNDDPEVAAVLADAADGLAPSDTRETAETPDTSMMGDETLP